MSQLALAMGRSIVMPDGERLDPSPIDPECDSEFGTVTIEPVIIDLSPAQAQWMGVEPPANPTCPGCVLFGLCAAHDNRDEDEVNP